MNEYGSRELLYETRYFLFEKKKKGISKMEIIKKKKKKSIVECINHYSDHSHCLQELEQRGKEDFRSLTAAHREITSFILYRINLTENWKIVKNSVLDTY